MSLSTQPPRSLPIWERGLKPVLVPQLPPVLLVAPYMGAWIETGLSDGTQGGLWSLPIWERGLKLVPICFIRLKAIVAPYMGAWIETHPPKQPPQSTGVAPDMGAWIETRILTIRRRHDVRRSLYGSVD